MRTTTGFGRAETDGLGKAAARRTDPMDRVLALSALVGLIGLGLIALFVLKEGLPIIRRAGLLPMLLGTEWSPWTGQAGILSMIAGSGAVTLGALILGVPAGLGAAVFLAEIAPGWFSRIVRPALDLLAGIPSVVYGFYGVAVLVPAIRQFFGGPGFSVLAGALVLGTMILPTIASISEDALRAVPGEYREASLALGATGWQTVTRVVLPAARRGILAAVVLATGRAVGETMAVIMVTGNVPGLPSSVLDPVRTLTGTIVLEMGYASGEHREALFAIGVVLLAFIMMLNGLANLIAGRAAGRAHISPRMRSN